MSTTNMKRIYVVEKAIRHPMDPKPGLTGPATEPAWVSVGTYDTPVEAGDHAADMKPIIGQIVDGMLVVGARVRQFWVASTPPTQTPLHGKSAPVDVPLVTLQCVDHPDVTVKVHSTANPPRCKYCSKSLTTTDMADALTAGDIIDLTKEG